MYLETERTILREFTLEDADALFEIFGDADTMRYFQGAFTREETREFLENFCIGRHGGLAVVFKGTGKLMAYLLFHELSPEVYEIGWAFHRAFRGQGLARESCRALIDYAFREKKAHKIFAETMDTGRSLRLMERLGMRREGIQRQQVRDQGGNWADMYFYGILKEEWEALSR